MQAETTSQKSLESNIAQARSIVEATDRTIWTEYGTLEIILSSDTLIAIFGGRNTGWIHLGENSYYGIVRMRAGADSEWQIDETLSDVIRVQKPVDAETRTRIFEILVEAGRKWLDLNQAAVQATRIIMLSEAIRSKESHLDNLEMAIENTKNEISRFKDMISATAAEIERDL